MCNESMAINYKSSSIPKRLLNECSFCHEKGIKPGILKIEFREDVKTQEYFLSITPELHLNNSGLCATCSKLVSS